MNPTLKQISISVGGAIAGVLIYATAITGSSYQGVIHTHLVDLIQGAQTKTEVVQNAPNWSFGTPMTSPIAPTIASTTAPSVGDMASSTQYTIGIAASDKDGTTTMLQTNTFTTAASTTKQSHISLQVSWPRINGAQRYIVYFATGTPSTLSQYFYATTTDGVANNFFTIATTSGSLAGSPPTDSSALTTRINPLGSSYLLGGSLGVGTSTPATSTPVDVNGYFRATNQGTSTACYSGTAGAMFFNPKNGHEWGCDGTTWNRIF